MRDRLQSQLNRIEEENKKKKLLKTLKKLGKRAFDIKKTNQIDEKKEKKKLHFKKKTSLLFEAEISSLEKSFRSFKRANARRIANQINNFR